MSLPSRVIHGARRALSASQFRRATASGALRAGEVTPGRAMRWFGRGLRGRRDGRD